MKNPSANTFKLVDALVLDPFLHKAFKLTRR